jgi:hypothetical protein
MSIAHTWGTSPEERALVYACDRYVDGLIDAWYRGVTVDAPAPVVFRWLCQLRAAPYSYDWIDNLGRRSPPQLTPGLEALAVGQRVMSIFVLAEFEQNRQITVQSKGSKLFGSFAATYMLVQQPGGSVRLLVKIGSPPARGMRARITHAVMVWGDLVMMRRQLLNLKRLAERSARGSAA